MRKAARAFACIISAGACVLLAIIIYAQSVLPSEYEASRDGELHIGGMLSLVPASSSGVLSPKIIDKNGGVYALKIGPPRTEQALRVQSSAVSRKTVIPGGTPFGIKMYTDGVMVVGMTDIQIGTRNVNPAKEAGVKIGDIIIDMNDSPVSSRSDVKSIIAQSEGAPVKISLRRGAGELECTLQPVLSEFEGGYKAGMWVRDSSAGIGTMTYYDPQSMTFAGLGHAVCDVDTGAVMPLSTGVIVDVNISGANIGQSGRPGELKGSFSENVIGSLLKNSEFGVFGKLSSSPVGMDPVPMATGQDIRPGPAIIYATISGNKPRSFDIIIEKVNYSDVSPTKNMVIRVTDPRLLEATGGIVQGMSGSPILQNGCLLGAVTHVFVNDPTRGYGIFAENMDRQISTVECDADAA